LNAVLNPVLALAGSIIGRAFAAGS